MKLNRKNLLLAATISLTLSAPAAHAASGTWNVDASGNWSLDTNWSSSPTVPGTAATDVIGLNNNVTAARTVTIDATSRTAGILNIGDSDSTHAFTLAASGAATLTLDNSGSGAQINETGSIADAISAPIALADNLAINTTGALSISSVISESAAGKILTKSGTGELYLTSTTLNTWSGGSTVSDGALSFRTTTTVPTTGTHAFGANATLGLGVGAGGFLIADVNNALGGTAPAVGTITLDASTKIGIDTGAGNFDFNISLATTTRGLDKLGGNNLTLSADNSTYDGDIRVVRSRILPTHSNALGSTVGSTTVLGGGGSGGNTLDFSSATTSLTTAEEINFFGNAAGRARLALGNTAALTHILSGAIDVTSDANIPEWSSGGATSLAAFKITGDITGTFSGTANGLLLRGNAHGTPASTPINKIEGNITFTAGGIVKTDSGIWRIGASGKTYSAPAISSANGVLQMGVADYLTAAAPVLTMGNSTGASTGSLDLNGFSQTVGGIIYNGAGTATGLRPITNSDLVNAAVLTVNNATDFTANGSGVNSVVLTGNLGLTKTGVGQLRLDGANTLTGAVNVDNGNLTIANYAGLDTVSSLTVSGGTAGLQLAQVGTGATTDTINKNLSLHGFLRTVGGNSTNTLALTWDGNITLAGASTITNNGNSTIDINGQVDLGAHALTFQTDRDGSRIDGNIIGAGGSFIKTGTRDLTLSGTNTYTGGTTVTAGRLLVTTPAALPGYDLPGKVTFGGGTVVTPVGGGWTTTQVDTLLTNAITTGGALGIDTTNGDLTQWVPFTTTNFGPALGLTKLGINTLTLDQANTYTGATTIVGGTLRLANLAALGASPLVTVGGGTTLHIATNAPLSGPALTLQGGTIISDRDSTGIGFTHVFGATAVSNSTHNFTGGANVNDGNAAIQLGNITNSSGANGTATFNPTTANLIIAGGYTNAVNAGTNTLALGGTSQGNSISGTIENGTRDTQSVTKSGTSTWTLSGSNTYTGATTISNNGGTLQIDNAAALPSASQISLQKTGVNTGTLRLNTSGTNVYTNTFASFQSANSTVNSGTPNIQNVQGDNTMSGNMIINAGGGNGVNIQSDAGLLTISGNLSTGTSASGTRPYTFSGAGNGVFSGEMSPFDATKTPAIIKHGAGTWSITGINSSFTGGVSVLDGVLNVASVADTGTNSSIGAGGPINLTGQGTSGTLQYTGSTAVTTNHTLTVAPTGGTLDASGTGSGTLKFTGIFTAINAVGTNISYTNGSNVATNGAATTPGTVGGGVMTIVAVGLAPGTTITSISGNSYTLSNPFTGTTGAVATTYTDNVARTLTLTGSNTGANEISSIMGNSAGGGALSIAKTGTGKWVLSGVNTYSGNTTVNDGTLSLAAADSATDANTGNDGSTVTIAAAPGAILDLAYTGTDEVSALFIGGVQKAAGIWGSSTSGAPNMDPKFTGTGTLTVATGPVAGYSAWASLNGATLDRSADHDFDGVSNGVEFFIGGPTGNTTGFTPLPGVVDTAGVLSVTWSKAAGYTGTYGTDFVVETSATLTGIWATESSPGTVVIGATTVTYTFPAGTKNFARLKVTGP